MEQKTQRWTVSKKTELILQIIKGETTIVEACRANDLKLSEVDGWIRDFLSAGTQGLKGKGKDDLDERDRQIKTMQAKIGELVLELDARKKLQALIDQEESNS